MCSNTLTRYEQVFEEKPPAAIWPKASVRFAAQRRQPMQAAWKWPVPLEYGVVLAVSGTLGFMAMACMWVLVLQWPVFPSLDGPAFLKLYLALLLASFGLFVVLRAVQKQAVGEAAAVDPYEAAWLCGGMQRAFNTALATLIKRELLIVNVRENSATCYLLPATCYLLPATCYLLPATCYLLPATGAPCNRWT